MCSFNATGQFSACGPTLCLRGQRTQQFFVDVQAAEVSSVCKGAFVPSAVQANGIVGNRLVILLFLLKAEFVDAGITRSMLKVCGKLLRRANGDGAVLG